ncbi:MAG: type II toxin-antitoxin system YafQ family toxin [Epsilonproteobacteria bacterium]|nr:MAG: type II toxin-antitoxin system YafQ family toxin [Campylobacterota bacterium]
MLKIFRTNSFKKDYKKLNTDDKSRLKQVVITLSNKAKLDKSYKDHKLIGNYFGCRECHIRPDLLLIYSIDDHTIELALVRVGSHSKLF